MVKRRDAGLPVTKRELFHVEQFWANGIAFSACCWKWLVLLGLDLHIDDYALDTDLTKRKN
jgi:hypothetical protein